MTAEYNHEKQQGGNRADKRIPYGVEKATTRRALILLHDGEYIKVWQFHSGEVSIEWSSEAKLSPTTFEEVMPYIECYKNHAFPLGKITYYRLKQNR